MTSRQAKQHYIQKHKLGKLTVRELQVKADTKGILVFGDKASILQCFDQSKQMTKLFRLNKK